MFLNLFILFIFGFLLSNLFIYLNTKLFIKFKILDNPLKYGHKRLPIPHSMGIILVFLFFILSYFFVDHNSKLFLLWFFGFLITFVSFLDDFFFLSPKIRLIIQIIIGIIISITSIKVGYINNIFGGIINLENIYISIFENKIYVISLVFTIIWYVFIFNSLNWSDGIVGNTAGLSIISFFVLFLLGLKLYFTDNYEGGIENAKFIIYSSFILFTILIPFWYFNVKERFLMGDSGTMFLAFMLASLSIISGGKIATALVVFGIYSVDAIFVIINRLINKKNPLIGDKTHLHYRLLDLGMSKKQTLIYIYIFSFIFGISSLFVDKFGKIIIFIFIIFFVILSPKIISKYFINDKK